MRDSNNIVSAAIAAVIAFLVAFVVIAIVEAVLTAFELGDAAAMVDKLQLPLSLLVALAAGYSRYNGRSLR